MEKKDIQQAEKTTDPVKEAQAKTGGQKPARQMAKKPIRRKSFKKRSEKPAEEFEQKMVDLARVTRVMAGGKRMKFRACMVIGDKNGRVGVGLAKGADVSMAISKSVTQAKKNLIRVPLVDGTIPHEIEVRNGSSRLMMRPARKGSGIKAGGVLRVVMELAGVKDVVAKIFGTNNKVNNAKTALLALNSFLPRAKQAASKAHNEGIAKKPVQKEDKSKDNKSK